MVSTSRWRQLSVLALPAAALLGVLVLIPGIGLSVNGASRWIQLPFLTVTVPVVMTWLCVIYIARYVAKHRKSLQTTYAGVVRPGFAIAAICWLMLMQPDFGSMFLLAFMALLLLFVSGARLSAFVALIIGAISLLAFFAIASPYRMARLTSYFNPWGDPLNSGYQLTQSLIAFGRGEIFGLGYGGSIQKLFYLPEVHSSFVLAMIAEETGAVGAIALIGILMLLVWRIWRLGLIAGKAGAPFAATFAKGVAIVIALATLVNSFSVVGLLPIIGSSLPFVSYGGTHLLILSVMLGMVARVELDRRAGRLAR